MKLKLKQTLAALAVALLAGNAFALTGPTISIPTPASSADKGGRAVVGIVMPQKGLDSAAVIDIVRQNTPAAPRSWTSYFVGQARADVNGFIAYVDGAGAVQMYSQGWQANIAALGIPSLNSAVSRTIGGTDGCGNSAYASFSVRPVGFDMYGSAPTDFVVDPVVQTSSQSGCGASAF